MGISPTVLLRWQPERSEVSLSLFVVMADRKAILRRWEGLNQYTLNRWLGEMRDNKQFKDYVINPTHKLVFINLEGFEEFLRWKQRAVK